MLGVRDVRDTRGMSKMSRMTGMTDMTDISRRIVWVERDFTRSLSGQMNNRGPSKGQQHNGKLGTFKSIPTIDSIAI
jgi:hypothetical protein